MKLLRSLSFFKRFSIRMRIFLLAGLGMIGMAALTGAYMLGDYSMKSAEHNEKMNAGLMKLVDQTVIMALQLRQHEKDFLLSADKKYAANYHEAAEHFSALVQAMDASPLSTSISAPVRELEEAVKRHVAAFDSTVQIQGEIGHGDQSGLNQMLQEQFAAIDHKLAAAGLDQLRGTLLVIARYMREFTQIQDKELVTYIGDVRTDFDLLLKSANKSPEFLTKLGAMMDEYQATIKKWMETSILLTGRIQELGAIHAAMAPALDKVTAIAKQGLTNARATFERTRSATHFIVLATSAAMLVFVSVIGFTVGRGISRPLAALTTATTGIAEGNIELEIPATEQQDEIGHLARAVLVFKQNAMEKRQLEAKEAEERAAKEQRAKSVEALIQNFEAASNEALQNVMKAASSLQDTSATMAAAAEMTNQQSETVRSGAETASGNVQTVASATEELSGSIDEISRQVSRSNEVAGKAVEESRKTRETMQGLAAAAETIGDVVNLIQEIAAQTNLLALNATIEAARAGEAGKGFAVVASEVKQLANQTSKATDEIAQQISTIQGTATSAVEAINQVNAVIEQISGYSTTIASAVEEQSSATRHIADNVQQAASGTNTVTESIGGLNEAANETTQAAQQVKLLSGNLADEAERLRKVATTFLENVRAA
ncbi:MAG: HAMP domain-containing protein [Alphaproteobacteria bacterium]|nr:HAMP domain-containing protein [Alphaproteobacteria bacterium]